MADVEAVYGGISWWFAAVSERLPPVATLSLSRFQFLSLKHCRRWYGNFFGACEGDEGKGGNLLALNAGGAHLSDVAVLKLKETKSGAEFNITFLRGAINEIFPYIFQ